MYPSYNEPMVKMLIVQNVGIVLGEVDLEEYVGETVVPHAIKIQYPMIMSPVEEGKMAAKVNPMFRESLIVNPAFIVGESSVTPELAEQYENYLKSKQSKLILPQTKILL